MVFDTIFLFIVDISLILCMGSERLNVESVIYWKYLYLVGKLFQAGMKPG